MSLAQKLETAVAGAVASHDARRSVEADKISLLRRPPADQRPRALVPRPDSAPPQILGAAPEAKRKAETPSHSAAISLIDEVSSIIPVLVDENETLRAVLKRDRERLEADVERATLVACEWRKSAEAAKLQVDTLERKLADLAERLALAEARAQSEKDLATRSAREAAEAECLSSLFEEKLLSSFGVGSPFQATLDRIRQRAEANAV